MAEVGRPTDLTDELLIKIKELVLDGKNLKEIANIIQIPEVTIYTWHSRNYLDFYQKVENWKRDRKLMLAEKNIEEFLLMDTINTGASKKGEVFEYNDSGLVRVKADISKFVSETLGKDNYSKRSELTGLDGKDLIPNKEKLDQANEAINKFLNVDTGNT